jgi:hypothetical protein
MRVPLSWLGELVDLAPGARGAEVAASLVSVGLEEEALHGGDITGPLVVGRVLTFEEQIQKNGKPIRFCTVDVGHHGQRVTDGIPRRSSVAQRTSRSGISSSSCCRARSCPAGSPSRRARPTAGCPTG